MTIFLRVEDFAKIESAYFCINQFTVIVGPNNSGKTFLLQLTQGIVNRLKQMINEDVVLVFHEFIMNSNNVCSLRIDNNNVILLTEYLNDKLRQTKEDRVKEIFGKDIAIGKLEIDIQMEDGEYFEILVSKSVNELCSHISDSLQNKIKHDGFFFANPDALYGVFNKKEKNIENPETIVVSAIHTYEDGIERSVSRLISNVFHDIGMYVPSSRTGLLLTFREYFANKTEQTREYSISGSDGSIFSNDCGELTQPMYEFIRLLQTYNESEATIKKNKKLLDFFERNLINGQIMFDKQKGLLYKEKDKDILVPMFLTSAMINELAPLSMILSAKNYFSFIVVDEVEASLHPEKQQELVRFLIRMFNEKWKLLISTHSDTVVNKLNNLYVLSKKNAPDNVLDRIGLCKEDMFDVSKLFVYELVTVGGRSRVNPIAPRDNVGFQFDMFTDSAMKLYKEAMILQENN